MTLLYILVFVEIVQKILLMKNEYLKKRDFNPNKQANCIFLTVFDIVELALVGELNNFREYGMQLTIFGMRICSVTSQVTSIGRLKSRISNN